MISKHFFYQPMTSKRSSKDQDEEETLSFCDLPIHCDPSADWEQSSPSQEEDLFEFFNSGFTAPPHQPEDIIFCGKLIPCQEPTSQNKVKTVNSHTKRTRRIFACIPASFNRAKGSSKIAVSKQQEKYGHVNGKFSAGRGAEMSSKSGRWCKFMFGSMRVPNEMELADIKSRQKQKRRNPKPYIAMFEDEQRNRLGRSNDVNGLKGLVRSLSCRCYYSTGVLEI